MNSCDYQSVECNGLTFLTPLRDPLEVIIFDPMRIRITPDGKVKIPGWFPQDDTLTIFRFDDREVVSLAAAIAQVNRFLRLYEPQFNGAPIVEQVRLAMDLYDNPGRRLRLPKSHDDIKTLLAVAYWIGDPTITAAMIAKGRRGRYFDPRPMARQLFTEVAKLDYKKLPSIRRMIVEMAAHKAVLMLGRQENHEILAALVADLTELLTEDVLFDGLPVPKSTDHYDFSGRAYNKVISRVEQIMAPIKRLWGAPYIQLSLEIRSELNCVIYSLRAHAQEEAHERIISLLDDLARCESSLKRFRKFVLETIKSPSWKKRKFASAGRRIDGLGIALGQFPGLLDPFTRLLRHDLMQINGLLIGKKRWEEALGHLHCLADRCMW